MLGPHPHSPLLHLGQLLGCHQQVKLYPSLHLRQGDYNPAFKRAPRLLPLTGDPKHWPPGQKR
ncbi:unnamed protein product, partial [Vitis vinifera]|uniref:Uncharacterized protein n=1 Tax=Vitis vinifera TaxID=29760 RepID=E0CQE3_VITVI